MSRIRPALVLFWASMAVIVASVLYLGAMNWQAGEEANIESVGVRPDFSASATPSPTAPTPSSAAPSPSGTPSATASASTEPTGSASASASSRPEPTSDGPVMVAAPMRVRIPALDVNTKVFPVALDKNRAIEIPEDIRYVGWYELGVPPGVDRGSAVLVAHRDGREQGRGVFYFLGSLKPGDKVYVKTSSGKELPYKVVSRESILKKRLPYEELFAVDGDPRLTLISCGGYYDPNNGGYQDNVVVTAVPMFTPISTETESAAPTDSATPAGTATTAAADQAVSGFSPQAATIDSEPVLLDGGSLN